MAIDLSLKKTVGISLSQIDLITSILRDPVGTVRAAVRGLLNPHVDLFQGVSRFDQIPEDTVQIDIGPGEVFDLFDLIPDSGKPFDQYGEDFWFSNESDEDVNAEMQSFGPVAIPGEDMRGVLPKMLPSRMVRVPAGESVRVRPLIRPAGKFEPRGAWMFSVENRGRQRITLHLRARVGNVPKETDI